MDRRALLTTLGAGAIGAGVIGSGRARGDDHEPGHIALDDVHKRCLEACGRCIRECDMTFHHCYEFLAAGKTEHALALHLTSDCAAFCMLAANMIAKHSPMMVHSCLPCAEACKACAHECETLHDDATMKHCARVCLDCEHACREMAEAMSSHH